MKRIVALALVVVAVVLSLASCTASRKLEKSADELLTEQAYKVKVTTSYSSYDNTVNEELKEHGSVCYVTIDGKNFEVERPVPNMTFDFSLIYTYYAGVLYFNEGEYGGWNKCSIPAEDYDEIYDNYVTYSLANEDFRLSNYSNHDLSINEDGYTVLTATGVKSSIAKKVESSLAQSVGSGAVVVDPEECKLVITLDELGRYKNVEATYYTVLAFSVSSQTVVTMSITYDYEYGDGVGVFLPEDHDKYYDFTDETEDMFW